MNAIGVIGVGRIGLQIASNLIKSGYQVRGYRRGSLQEFESLGGTPAGSPAEIGEHCDTIFLCLPTDEALDEVVQGPKGLVRSARPGQIITELGTHPQEVMERQISPLAAKGAVFLDGEVSGTPGMVAARKAAIYMAGDEESFNKVEPVIKGFSDTCFFLGPFGAAGKVKLINNLLVAVHIAAAAEAVALGLKAGVDIDLMIKAITDGSGNSLQFGIRAPWMAQRRFMPAQGTLPLLSHYFEWIRNLSKEAGSPTPLLDRTEQVIKMAIDAGIGDQDGAALVDYIGQWPPTAT